MEPLLLTGPEKVISGINVPVLCVGKVNGVHHVSLTVVSSRLWAVQALDFADRYHLCRTTEQNGCAVATTLRAVGLAVGIRENDTLLDLKVGAPEALKMLERWRAGKVGMPGWYGGATDGSLPTLAQMVAADSLNFRVGVANLGMTPRNKIVKNLAVELAHCMDQTPEDKLENHFRTRITAVLANLPD